MKPQLTRLIVLLGLLALPFSIIAAPIPVGSTCQVELRGDAVGPAMATLTSTNWFKGKLKSMDKDWVCIQTDKNELWIPVSSILFVKVEPEA